jgi:hypothetical protein
MATAEPNKLSLYSDEPPRLDDPNRGMCCQSLPVDHFEQTKQLLRRLGCKYIFLGSFIIFIN